VTFPLMAIVAVVARPAVDTVFDARWESLTPLIWILAPVGAIQSVTGATYSLLMAKGHTGLLFRWVIFSSAMSFAGYIIGLHFDGLIGLCWATAITTGFLTPFNLVIVFRRIGLSLSTFVAPLIPITFGAFAGAGVALGVDDVVGRVAGPAVVLTAGVVAGFATVAGLTLLLRPQALEDGMTALRSRGANAAPLRRGGDHRPAPPAPSVGATDRRSSDQLVDLASLAAMQPRGRHRHP
jgi:O-antigen/teichoic acid export membrane protein